MKVLFLELAQLAVSLIGGLVSWIFLGALIVKFIPREGPWLIVFTVVVFAPGFYLAFSWFEDNCETLRRYYQRPEPHPPG